MAGLDPAIHHSSKESLFFLHNGCRGPVSAKATPGQRAHSAAEASAKAASPGMTTVAVNENAGGLRIPETTRVWLNQFGGDFLPRETCLANARPRSRQCGSVTARVRVSGR